MTTEETTFEEANGTRHTTEEADRFEEPRRNSRQDEEEPKTLFELLKAALKTCGMFCYIGCPPTVDSITSKLAFHPPPKDQYYTVKLDDEPQKVVRNAKELYGKNFAIELTPLPEMPLSAYEGCLDQVSTFTVKTELGNILIGVRCKWKSAPWERANALKQVIIFAQPNSSTLGAFLQPGHVTFTQMANIYQADVYGFDYSGFGYSSGCPSERNVYADIKAVYELVRRERPFDKIVLMGFSIGTTAVVDMASKRPSDLSGVVLVAPFTSGLRLLCDNAKDAKTNCMDRFRSVDKIERIDVPVLICHGDRDEVIPHEHAVVLHGKLKRPVVPIFVHGANHQTILNGQYLEVFRRIRRFLHEETDIPKQPQPTGFWQ